MASFTDRSPATYTPYISQNPVEAMVTVGMDRESKYLTGVQRVQDQINNVSALSNSLLRPQAKQYLANKLESVITDINAAVGQDFSDPNVYGALLKKAGEIGSDQALNVELQGSLQASAKERSIQALKEKDPKLYSQYNEEYAMGDIREWLSSGSPVGTALNDTKPFSPYYNYSEEIQKATQDFLSRPDEFDQLDPNTGIVIKHKGKTAQQLQMYLGSVLSGNAKNQMNIEGYVIGNRMGDSSILKLYNNGIDSQIDQEKQINNELQKQYFQPNSALTQGQKNILKDNIANSNLKISKLESDKTNPDMINSALQNRGEFYAQLYGSSIIDRVASSSATSSITYESNSATVQALDRAFNQRMEVYRQGQMNARESMSNNLGWAKLNQERELKLLELEGLGRLPGAEGYQVGGYSRTKTTSITIGTSTGEPYSVNVPVGRTPTNTRVEEGVNGYNRFTNEAESLVVNYGLSKENLLKQLMEDPIMRNEVSGAMGETGDQTLSRYVASPKQGNIYYRFLTGDSKLRQTFDNMIEAKHNQWLKNQDVGSQFNKFFSETDQTRVKLEARDNYNKLQKETLRGNLNSMGISDLQVNGKVITVDDMIDYVASGGKNAKVLSAKTYTPSTFTSYGGGMVPTPNVKKGTMYDFPPALLNSIKAIENSQALKEYKNNFNETFGAEGQLKYTSIPIDDKKNVYAQQYYNQQAAQIATLFNDSKRGTQINPSDINPEWITDQRTGEVTFSYTTTDAKGGKIVSSNNKIIVPSLKNQFNDVNADFNQTLFYGRGSTPLMNIRGLRPLKVSVKSSSTDPASQYTVNSDGTPATYHLTDSNGNYIKDPLGGMGFPNPTSALKFIEEFNNQSVIKNVQDWYQKVSQDSRFNNLDEAEQANYMDQYIQSIDPTHNIQTLSNNPTLNMLRDLRSATKQQAQNQSR